MALSMSVSAGKHNARHNTDLAYRAKLPNVDPRLSRLNLTIKEEPIGKAYDRIFGKSLSDYNAKQKSKGHGERCIADYHAKIEGAWKADSAKVDSHKKGRSNVPKPRALSTGSKSRCTSTSRTERGTATWPGFHMAMATSAGLRSRCP